MGFKFGNEHDIVACVMAISESPSETLERPKGIAGQPDEDYNNWAESLIWQEPGDLQASTKFQAALDKVLDKTPIRLSQSH